MSRKPIFFAAIVASFLCLALLRPSRPRADILEHCPISLTNPDGQALALVKYDLRAAIHGALSLVEMEMTFRNPENRQMEGRFVYTLPPNATISRFAKEVNGKLMEGEVVERLRAQAVYTEILHTMRDPALLEADQGNRFSARVFPVPANGTVRLLLAFSQQLPMKDGVRKLRIPLAGLPKIGEFNFNVFGKALNSETGSGVILDKEEAMGEDFSALSRHSVDFTPTKDIEITFKANGAGAPFYMLRAGKFQMVQFRCTPPPTTVTATAAPLDWSFYFDTSASGADTEASRLQVLDRLLDKLSPVLLEKNGYFSASAFDVDVAELVTPIPLNAKGGEPVMPMVLHKLRARHALGATNLEAALKDIGAKARAAQKPCTFVLVSDGIATWGARESKELLAALGDWPERHTLHALVIGNRVDEKTLNAIVEKTRGRIVALPLTTDVEGNVAKTIADLRAPLGAKFEAYDEGTAWIYPKTFHDVRPGQELIAFSEIRTEGGKSMPGFIQRGVDGKTISDTPISGAPVEVADFAPLLQREAYKAYLDFIEKEEQAQSDAMKRKELHQKRIDISVRNRVVCPLTSLLVLETNQDYARFGILRSALTDIMQIGKGGIELRRRASELDSAELQEDVRRLREQLHQLANAAAPKRDEAPATKQPVEELEKLRAEVARLRDEVNAQKASAATPVDRFAVTTRRGGLDFAERSSDHDFMLEGQPATLHGFYATGGGPGNAAPNPNDIPHSDYLLYPDDWRQIAQRTGETAGRTEIAAATSTPPVLLHPRQDPNFPAPSPETQIAGRRGEAELRINEVRDLTQTVRGFPGPRIDAGASASTSGTPAVFRDEQYYFQINADKPNEPARYELRTRKVLVTPAQPAAVRNAGPWINDDAIQIADAQLADLRAKIEGNPRERKLRNAYADALLKAQKWDNLQAEVFQWLPFDPENPAVYEFLGKSATGLNDPALALRAYSSIAEIAPNRAALLTRAGFLMLTAKKFAEAEALFREALKNRQDDANIHRGLALSLYLAGNYDGASSAYETALMRDFNQRYGDVKRVLREEFAYVLRAWRKKEPAKSNAIVARAEKAGVDLLRADALRVTMCWETDANDVDLHVVDPNGEECFYSHKNNVSGLELYSDQTQGLGPEVIRTDKTLPGTYHIGVNYFNAGPMGVSRGVVVIMKPVEGIDENPQIIPFALIEGNRNDMRHVGSVAY